MNIKNLNALIARLESVPDEKFNIAYYFSDARTGHPRDDYAECRTAACIAGWAAVIEPSLVNDGMWLLDTARDWLGIGLRQSDILFCPEGYDDSPQAFPRARAIDVLKHLRDTGEVNWKRFPAKNYRGESPSA